MPNPKEKEAISEGELLPIVERLAVKVHAAWMEERRSQGWSYGPRRDDARKQHPCLVAYEALPESEKALDRRAARTAILGLMELGYALTRRENGVKTEDASRFAELRQRLDSQPQPDMATLPALWRQYRRESDCPAELLLKLGELVLKRGEPILAYDALARGLEGIEAGSIRSPAEERTVLRLRQLLCLALAQSGAAERACVGLEQLRNEGHDTPETLGLLGRVHKDLALLSADAADRHVRLGEALRFYQLGFARSDTAFRERGEAANGEDAYYCGINAAAAAALLGQTEVARHIAERVREICESISQKAEPNYWLLATLGEAELICGRHDAARQWYARAVKAAGDNWRELTSTRRQVRRLSRALGLSVAEWETVFPKVGVVAFASPPWAGDPMPPASDWHAGARQIIQHRLCEAGVVAGYLSVLSPADVMVGECLVDRRAEVHIVLPYSRALCRAVFASEPTWQQRWDRLLARASSIVDEAEGSCLDERVNIRFAGMHVFGAASLRADRLDGELCLWSCNQVPWPTWVQPEDAPSRYCRHPRCAWESILPVPSMDATAETASQGGGSGRSPRLDPGAGAHEIKAMLFGDVKGYSKLDDAALFRFSRVFMQNVSRVLARHETRIVSRRTAGDGLFLVFADVAAAAEVAFALRDMMRGTAWSEFDLPAQLGARFSLDAGPVYVFHDAVMQRPEVCGAYVNRAARIEPITPPNEVYASEAFASLYVATGADQFRFEYVGQTQLPKGFGLTPLYCLSRQATQTNA